MIEPIKITRYQALKIELDTVENELKTHKNMSYELYSHLKMKQELLQQRIDECALIYEIWFHDYDGSMRMDNSSHKLKERYSDKDKAYNRLNELNDGCNYGNPYYISVEEIDG